jgi:hypothetical protein
MRSGPYQDGSTSRRWERQGAPHRPAACVRQRIPSWRTHTERRAGARLHGDRPARPNTRTGAGERINLRPQFVSEVERGMRWHTLTTTVRAYGSTLAELADEIERDGSSER